MRRYNQGWKAESERHSLARRGVKTGRKSKSLFSPLMAKGSMPDFDLNSHYWAMKKEGNHFTMSLGNLSDAGWYWDGGEGELNGFLIRLSDSKARQDFLDTMKKEGITFEQLKPFLMRSIESGDGLYMISGDNVFWHFGEGIGADFEDDRFNEDMEQYNMSDEERKKVIEDAESNYSFDFDEFEKENKKDFVEDFKDKARTSKSFEDYFNTVETAKDAWMETRFEYTDNKQYEAFQKSLKEARPILKAQEAPDQTRLADYSKKKVRK